MSGEVSFIELGVADAKRGRAFYEALFGWKFAPGPARRRHIQTTPRHPGDNA